MIRSVAMMAVVLCWITGAGAASSVSCSVPSNVPSVFEGYLAISPSAPDFTQSITITVGRYAYTPRAIDVRVHVKTIDVTFTAQSIDFIPPPQRCFASVVGRLPPGVYKVNLSLVDWYFPESGRVLLQSKTLVVSGPSPLLPDALSGLWWNAGESGWGINLTQRGNVVFAVWYTYDAAGNPKWYVAPHCALPAAAASGNCTETIYEVNGPTFFGTAFDPFAVRFTAVGSMSLTFNDANTGSMTYTLGGLARTVPIARQELPTGSTPAPIDYTDLWWDPSESGWGLAVTHRFGVMFLAWFVYDGAGKPVWYVASNCSVNASQDGCTGTLYRTTGPGLGPTFDTPQVQVFPVGSVSLAFPDPNNGTLSYTVNGVSSTKAITRQLF